MLTPIAHDQWVYGADRTMTRHQIHLFGLRVCSWVTKK
jgi:hypothetical protein